MALHTLGTTSTTALTALSFARNSLLTDIGDLSQAICGDKEFATPQGYGTGGPAAILATGSTHGTRTLDTLVQTAGGPLASIQLGSLIVGVGIPPATYVAQVLSPTSVLMSKVATTTLSGVFLAFIPPANDQEEFFSAAGLLKIPGGRGILRVGIGDIVAIDNTGWPILVSAAARAYAGSLWSFA